MAKQNKVSLLEFVNPSRNYLMLIVLLITAVCVVLGLTFATAADSLDVVQRWFFIFFLVSFPVLGLTISLRLMLRHYRKLSIAGNDSEIGWKIMPAAKQQQKLNGEVSELAKILSIPANQMSDLRSAYIVAEDLALRHIEKESQLPLMRHISLEGIEFDAVLINQEIIKCVEVTFLVTPNISDEKIAVILGKVEQAKKKLAQIRPHTKLVLLLALVTQLDRTGEAKLRSNLGSKFDETPVDVDIRLFDFEELQRIFTAE